MGMKVSEILKAREGSFNLQDVEKAYDHFSWDEIERTFSWYESGKVNAAYEAIDRHTETDKKDKIALYYQNGDQKKAFTFDEMKRFSNRVANVLTNHTTLKKKERLFTLLPRIPELYFSILGAMKMGVTVGPLFEAFMEQAIYDRLADSQASVLITTKELLQRVPIEKLPYLETIFVIGDNIEETEKIIDFQKKFNEASEDFNIVWLDLDDELFIHYTSGSTTTPKGIVHVQRSMIHHYQTAKFSLDLKEDDIYWCTADPGWMVGSSYGILGPWIHGVTNVVVGNRFSPHTWYNTIQRYRVTVWYSAPTAFRMLMGAGKSVLKKYNLSSLRHIAAIGEALNPEVIQWGMKQFGQRIHDTYWATEMGGIMISNYPCMDIKIGSIGKPIPGVHATIIDQEGNELPPYTLGHIAFEKGWPSMMSGIWNNSARYEKYFLNDRWFISGDSGFKDEDGYFYFQGRADDVIMTSGERVGPYEVEKMLMEHPKVKDVGVIGKPDALRGEIIKAYVVVQDEVRPSDELAEELRNFVRTRLSAHAAPREIEFKEQLPKTRSGKIVRRVLKSWESNVQEKDKFPIDS